MKIKKEKQTLNAQRPILNSERVLSSTLGVGRWALDVRRFLYAER